MTEHGWVTCAPGDPNEEQLDAIVKLSGALPYCIHRFNADTSEVDVVVNRAWGEARFIVDRSGVALRVSRWTIERRGPATWSLLYDGELVAGANHPIPLLLYVPTLNQKGPA